MLIVADGVLLDGTRASVGFADGRVRAVGALRDVRAACPGAEELDAACGLVLPGLGDAHLHLVPTARALEEVDLSGARSEDELAALCAVASARLPPGAWLVGGRWDHERFPEGRFPRHAALSAAVPDRPAYLQRIDGHAALVNAAALARAGVTRETPAPPGGAIERLADGSPAGVLVDAAMELVFARIPAPGLDETRRLLGVALRRCAEAGLASVHDAALDATQAAALEALGAEDALLLSVFGMLDAAAASSAAALARGPVRSGAFHLGAVKLFADGALGSRGALLFDDYADAPGCRGLAVVSPERLRALAEQGVARGFRVAVHAIGDRANAEVLDLFETLGAERPRVEHAQLVRPADFARFVRVGAVASVQPMHSHDDAPWAGRRLGARVANAYAWRALRDAGAALAFGSDSPIATVSPLAAIAQATGGWREEQRVSAEDAVHACTRGVAFAAGEERVAGALEVGLRGDATVLERVPRSPAEWREARVRFTLARGRLIHAA